MAATQATEAAEPQTQPAETSPATLPEIELVTPKPAPIIQQPVTPTVPQPPAPEATTPAAPAEEVPMPQPPIMTDDVAFALNDLASRLGVAADAISVVRVEEVDWPDGSLGCPQPDMRYTQALVNGTFIQLRAGDQLYNYHSGGRRQPFLCTSKTRCCRRICRARCAATRACKQRRAAKPRLRHTRAPQATVSAAAQRRLHRRWRAVRPPRRDETRRN